MRKYGRLPISNLNDKIGLLNFHSKKQLNEHREEQKEDQMGPELSEETTALHQELDDMFNALE